MQNLAALRAFPNSISPQQPDHKSQFFFVFLTLTPKQHILSQPLLSHSAPPTSITISPPSPPAPPLAAPPVATLWPLTMVPLQWCAAGLPLGGGHLARRALLAVLLTHSGVTLTRGVGLCASATSFWVAGPTPPILRPISTIPSTSVRVCAAAPGACIR